MLKRLLTTFATIVFALSGLTANAAPNSKLDPYSPSQTIADRCGFDSSLKGQAALVQSFLMDYRNCSGPARVVASKMTNSQPKSQLSLPSDYLELANCKLPQPSGTGEFRGFPSGSSDYYSKKHHPTAGSLIQVIGVSAKDAPAGKLLPSQEYKFYLDAVRAWFGNVNNSSNPVTIRVTDKWYELEEAIAPYKLNHKKSSARVSELSQKILTIADADIDFTGVGYVLVVLPAATPFAIAEQTGLQGGQTAEGRMFNMSVAMQPNLARNQKTEFTGFLSLPMWIHELYHPGFNLGDQYGDGKWNFKNRGMGQWGIFASGTSDMLHWQKWLAGFTTDSQVKCAPKDMSTTTWLAPGSTKTSKQKMVVVPLSSTEAIVVESVRATGLNYKLSTVEQGALVYSLDTTDLRHGYGYEVQVPKAREQIRHKYAMGHAPLKKGESLTFKGVKITNVEWGAFGDVIRVEPAK